MRKLGVVLIVPGMLGLFASISKAQDLQQGIWSGTRTLNGTTEEITFQMKRVQGQAGPSLTGTMIPSGGNVLELRDIRLNGDNLSYVAIQPNGVQQQCSLTLQKDRSFLGKCARTGGNLAVFDMAMIPPKEGTPEATISTTQEVVAQPPKELPNELPLGKWTGTRTPNGNANAVDQQVTFELNQFPDPHGRWRIGPDRFVTAAMVINPRQKFGLRDIRLEGDSLSFVIEQPQPNELQCALTRQQDGTFAGNCPRIRDKQAGFKVTMIPPKKEATATPKETTAEAGK